MEFVHGGRRAHARVTLRPRCERCGPAKHDLVLDRLQRGIDGGDTRQTVLMKGQDKWIEGVEG